MFDTASHSFPLLKEIQRYISLKFDYYRLDTLEKSSLLLGKLLLIFACLLFGCFSLLCLSFALSYLIGAWLGNFIWGFFLVALVYLLLIVILNCFKEKLIFDPMVRILNKTLFKDFREHEETDL